MLTWIDGCWYNVFLDAFTYSTNYLLFAITLIVTSIIMVWIYEKPQIYKLIFKRSKHSNILSPIPSVETLDINFNTNSVDHDKSWSCIQEEKIQEDDLTESVY